MPQRHRDPLQAFTLVVRLKPPFAYHALKAAFGDASEPHVFHRSTIRWKFFEAVVPFKMTDWKLADW